MEQRRHPRDRFPWQVPRSGKWSCPPGLTSSCTEPRGSVENETPCSSCPLYFYFHLFIKSSISYERKKSLKQGFVSFFFAKTVVFVIWLELLFRLEKRYQFLPFLLAFWPLLIHCWIRRARNESPHWEDSKGQFWPRHCGSSKNYKSDIILLKVENFSTKIYTNTQQ